MPGHRARRAHPRLAPTRVPARRGGARGAVARRRTGGAVSDLAVIGCGYVGSVSAACLASLGHRVRAVDVDEERLARLRRGDPPFVETGLPGLVRHERGARRLSFVADVPGALSDANAVLICVATPTTSSGAADLTQLWRAPGTIAPEPPTHAVAAPRSPAAARP